MGAPMPVFSSTVEPDQCLSRVRLDTAVGFIEDAEIVLGVGHVLRGGLAQPERSLAVILRNAASNQIAYAKLILCSRDAGGSVLT